MKNCNSFLNIVFKALSFFLFSFPLLMLSETKPFFCEKTSYFEGDYLFAVGIATDNTEDVARQKAFENGKNEIKNYFQKEVSIPEIYTQRTFSKKTEDGYYVCRLLKININEIKSNSFSFSSSNVIGNPNKNHHKFKILTNPSMATIIINGDVIGRTDALLEKVSSGTHNLILQKEGYQTLELNIEITKDSVLSYQLDRRKVKLTMQLNVIEGQIFIDGKLLKNIFSKNEVVELLVMNTYKIEVRSPNHTPLERTIIIGPNDFDIKREFFLEGHPGKVTIITEPSKANVIVNGNLSGKSPLTLTLAPGKHNLRIQYIGFSDYDSIFNIMPAENIILPTINLIEHTRKSKEKSSPGVMKLEFN